MYTTQSDKVLLGRGKVYFDRFTTAGAATGLRFLGDVSKLEITTNDDKAQIYDYSVSSSPLLNEVVTKREVSFAMTLHEFLRENLALALMGVEAQYTQSSSGVVDETLTTSSVLGRVYQTAKRAISAITVKQASTTLTAGVDYDVIDTVLGLIHIKESSPTVTAGSTITVSYTGGAITSPGLDRIQAGQSSQILGKLVFVGDPGVGPVYDLEVWKLSISSEGALGLITGTDFGSFEVKGKVLVDSTNHPTEPYFRMTKRP